MSTVPVVILAGGRGTRLAEETQIRPKPMVNIGNKPILWHIMKQYAHHDFKEFYIALGYKGDYIKRFFLDYYPVNSNITINLGTGERQFDANDIEDWTIHLIDTGVDTMTGGRILRLKEYLNSETFMVTYGDGVSDVDVNALLAHHRRMGKLVTVTAVRPPARFGGLIFDGEMVSHFTEKPQAGEGWINGGFLVCEPAIFDYLTGDDSVFEHDLLERVARDGQLTAYKHDDFWQCMDTVRDRDLLRNLWDRDEAPWKLWS
ncbi:MAG: glucose-1-phosphate cytidylyltransferase [Chloroflexota bacterium]